MKGTEKEESEGRGKTRSECLEEEGLSNTQGVVNSPGLVRNLVTGEGRLSQPSDAWAFGYQRRRNET